MIQHSGMVFNVVLDTRVDEFEASKLSNNGLYVSRKYIYGVSPQKTEIRSLVRIIKARKSIIIITLIMARIK